MEAALRQRPACCQTMYGQVYLKKTCLQGMCLQDMCLQGVCLHGMCLQGVGLQGMCVCVRCDAMHASRACVCMHADKGNHVRCKPLQQSRRAEAGKCTLAAGFWLAR